MTTASPRALRAPAISRLVARAAGVAAAAALAVLSTAEAQESTERRTLAGTEVAIYNIVGHVRVVAGTGSNVTVDVTRRGRDARRLEVEQGELKGRQTLRVVYPDDDIVYPALGRRGEARGRARSDGTFGDGRANGPFSAQEVTVRRDGEGVEAWADLTVSVPRGRTVMVHLMAGELAASDVDAGLVLDVHAASVTTERTRGRLVVDAGSGMVRVRGAEGDVILDTGSGNVELSQVRARSLVVDAGSGRITGSDIASPTMRVDLGSGGARLAGVTARELRVDTGSGDVDLELASDVDDLLIDSGSGDVTLRIPSTLGATVEAEVGRGGLDTGMPLQLIRRDDDHLVGRLGDGRGRIRIDSGSGEVRLVPKG